MPITLSTAFDAGNAELLASIAPPLAGTPTLVRLDIRPDHGSTHFQWFHFRLSGVRDQALEIRIENAGKSSYPEAWPDYRAAASTDRQTWFRLPTTYVDGVLTIRTTPSADSLWVAYFAPYSLERHHDLIARAVASGQVRHDVLGLSLDGHELDRLVLGTGPRVLWLIARQHPGESMASWWMEGLLERLLDPDDALSRELLSQATVHVVPHMNPDGAVRGHLRTNACGANLNREWATPSLERSPEVKLVLDQMDHVGCDLCLDVHGDEALPYNFLSGAEGIPGWTARLHSLQEAFATAYVRANPDLQREHGYPVDKFGEANMTMCTSAVAQRFDCLSYTLEMPFKDNAMAPDPVHGWSPARCLRLGASCVDALAAVVGELR